MIHYRKRIVLCIATLWSILSACEHHCCPPAENIERTLEIREPLTTKGEVDGDAYLNSHVTLENLNGRFDIHNIVAKWTRFGEPVSYRTYLKLDLSEIKDNEEIESAILVLHTKPNGSDNKVPDNVGIDSIPNYIQVCLVEDSWDLEDLTWVHQPRISPLPDEYLYFNIPSDFPPIMRLDLTALVKKIAGKDKKDENNGFLFRMYTEGDFEFYQSFVFYSINAGRAKQPYLKVRLIPSN
ncbi:DNRLRE domain-containing protein [Sporocytophaga myxococcoides]|uniref:DNRLRE domain-containing protein n=1 Tax=Sporocytophaga myxococcoides TaxID=153721 RepID=UPI000400B144|nr:DNRLRE domain-containing protein [Sporocytophaga myxococcoides]